ncbi:MAG: hypothetical protein HRU09_21125 [Oligoflexales bacterium]|nr:hypothetical protein [Oligoflexales bacterium]
MVLKTGSTIAFDLSTDCSKILARVCPMNYAPVTCNYMGEQKLTTRVWDGTNHCDVTRKIDYFVCVNAKTVDQADLAGKIKCGKKQPAN